MTAEKASLDHLIRRIDAMMVELAALRDELQTIVAHEPTGEVLADALYGVLGHGSDHEYELVDDWERFA